MDLTIQNRHLLVAGRRFSGQLFTPFVPSVRNGKNSSSGILPRTVSTFHSFTPGFVSLHPGLLIFIPSGDGSWQIHHRGPDIRNCLKLGLITTIFPFIQLRNLKSRYLIAQSPVSRSPNHPLSQSPSLPLSGP